MSQDVLWEGDTAMGHYEVVDTLYDGRRARVLYSGDRQAAQSGLPQDNNPDMLFDYNQRMFELATSLKLERLLLIGGGVGTLATALLSALQDLRIDLVEPDSGLTELAYKYFDLPVDTRLQIFHTDGRSFLRESTMRYDLILVDAFMHTTIPRELKTVEVFQAYYNHLKAQGILTVNVISGYYGPNARVLREMYLAAKTSFETTDIFFASRGYSLWLPQNFILTAQKDSDLPISDYMRYKSIEPPEVKNTDLLRDS